MKIVVMAGGISTERDVSLVTGKCIYEALKRKGHKVILADAYLGFDRSLLSLSPDEIFDLDRDWAESVAGIAEAAPDIESVKALRDPSCTSFFGPGVIDICKAADVVFMGLHGENGENGKVQAYFDLEGITYTGNDYLSSAICMNKELAKEILAYNGIPVPKGRVISGDADLTNTMGYPCVVKVRDGGSSVGVYICHNEQEYERSVKEALKIENHLIVEEYVKGREFSVCVMDGKALPIIEIAPREEFYDYKSKYQEGATEETCPALLSDNKTKEMQALAERGFKALKLNSYARLDFLMRETDESLYCLEANTLPGMTPLSLVPQEARAVGIGFDDLCEKLVESALKSRD